MFSAFLKCVFFSSLTSEPVILSRSVKTRKMQQTSLGLHSQLQSLCFSAAKHNDSALSPLCCNVRKPWPGRCRSVLHQPFSCIILMGCFFNSLGFTSTHVHHLIVLRDFFASASRHRRWNPLKDCFGKRQQKQGSEFSSRHTRRLCAVSTLRRWNPSSGALSPPLPPPLTSRSCSTLVASCCRLPSLQV